MSQISLQNFKDSCENILCEINSEIGRFKGYTVTFIKSGAFYPALIGCAAIAITLGAMAIAIMLTIKTTLLVISGVSMLISGVGIASGLAYLSWSAITATSAMTIALLTLFPLATAFGAFQATGKSFNEYSYPT